jgi:hypothetical protein
VPVSPGISPPIPAPLASIHRVKLQLFLNLKSAVCPEGEGMLWTRTAKQATTAINLLTDIIVEEMKK